MYYSFNFKFYDIDELLDFIKHFLFY